MTLNGAIMQLVELSEHPMMPVIFRPAIQKVIETISELEENPEPRWIPVTERPPKEDVDVLCKTLSGVMLVASYGKLNPWTEEKGWITSEFNRFSTDVLREWMPLPGEDRTEGSSDDHQ